MEEEEEGFPKSCSLTNKEVSSAGLKGDLPNKAPPFFFSSFCATSRPIKRTFLFLQVSNRKRTFSRLLEWVQNVPQRFRTVFVGQAGLGTRRLPVGRVLAASCGTRDWGSFPVHLTEPGRDDHCGATLEIH